MKKFLVFPLLAVALMLAGCAQMEVATGVYQKVTETTVPAATVIPTANAFDILKIAATNYGSYCIQQKMAPAPCSADTRRIVIKAVRSGTAARKQLEDSVISGQPAVASIYNVLVAAVQGLQKTPVATAQFVETAK